MPRRMRSTVSHCNVVAESCQRGTGILDGLLDMDPIDFSAWWN